MPTARQTRPAPVGCAGHEEDLGDETMLNAYAREEPLSDPRVVIAGISCSRMEDICQDLNKAVPRHSSCVALGE
jgi:hypothetical protein